MAFGSGSMTVPSRTIASSLGFGSVVLLLARMRLLARWARRRGMAEGRS
jgi:hypothetical protein